MSDVPDPQSMLAALQQWARTTLPAPPSGHPGPECQWCPLCQVASVLRGEHPELTDRLAEAGAAVSNAVRLLVDAAAARAGGTGAGGPAADAVATDERAADADGPAPGSSVPAPAPADRPQPRPRVQRIVLDDETPRG